VQKEDCSVWNGQVLGISLAPDLCWLVLGFSRVWIQVYELDPHSDLTLELNLMGLHGLKPGQELDLTSVKGFLQGLGHRVG
jgi:hypothetical protein